MFPLIFLAVGSFACLWMSGVVFRAKESSSSSPFLQRENGFGYLMCALGLAWAACHNFLRFQRHYELQYNRRLGLDYFGIDLNRPIPLIYAAFLLGTLCYLIWSRRKSNLQWSGGRTNPKRMVSEALTLAVLLGIITFGCFVWPTPWRTRTEGVLPDTVLPGPLKYQGQLVTEFRTNRITGENEAKMGDHWEHEYDRM